MPEVTGWIELEGAHNVRDLGGLPAAGGHTRPGVLLRSDALDACTTADVDRLVDIVGLAQVIDLRTPTEQAERGRGLLGRSSVRYSELSILNDGNTTRRVADRAEAVAAGKDPTRIMVDGYVQFLEVGGAAFVTALERVVAPGGTPALVHCAAGKDRTGVMVAVLLDAAGVDRDAIVADYAATHERMAPIVERLQAAVGFQRIADRVPAFVMEARPATMRQFLAELDKRWDGAANYLSARGAGPESIDKWLSLLVG